jgi:hypothetical protein
MADYIVTYDVVQSKGNLPNVKQATIEAFFPEAKKDVIDIIGADAYAEKFALAADDDDRLNVSAGEAYFVLVYLLPAIAKKSSGDGIIKATGFGESRTETVGELELNQMIDRYRAVAVKLLKPYALALDADDDDKPDQCIIPGLKMGVIGSDYTEDEIED